MKIISITIIRMNLKNYYNCNPTIYEKQEFIDGYVFERKSRSAIKNKLEKQYNLKSESPLVRAFLIYLYFKRNNNNNIIEREEKKEIVEEEEEEEEDDESEEEGTFELDWKPVKTPVSKVEMESFTKEKYLASTEYKYLLENNGLPQNINVLLDSPNTYWQMAYNNLKISYKNLIYKNKNT